MRTALCLAMTALAAILPQPVPARTPSAAADEGAALVRLERDRLDATMRRDIPALDRMTAPDLLYGHAGGIRQNKSEYLAFVKSGGVTYVSYDISQEKWWRDGATAVSHGIFSYTTAPANGPARSGKTFFTAVYVKAGGSWRLSNWMATRIP